MRHILLIFALVGCAADPTGTGPDDPLPGYAPPGDPLPPEAEADPGARIFATEILHEIEITVDPSNLGQLENDVENRVPCRFRFDDVVVENAGCRKKGGLGSVASLDAKTGFTVKFDSFVDHQKLDGLARLTLNSAIQDPTLLAEHLGYEVYRRVGIPAHRTAHGVVTFNGVPKGVFVLSESADKAWLKRAYGNGKHQGNLYEGPFGVDVTDPSALELKNEFEENRSREDVIAFADIVANTPDDALPAALASVLDIEGFATGFAVDALLDHWDGYSFNVNNYYLYSHPDGRFRFLPHGMDQLFGDTVGPDTPPVAALSTRFRSIPELDARFQAAVRRVANVGLDLPALTERAQRLRALLSASPRTDEAFLADRGNLEQRIDLVLEFLSVRASTYQ